MRKLSLRLASVVGGLALVANAGTASAQIYPAGSICECVTPVVQQHYRTVPVTEYRQVKQVVQRPIVETEYVEQPVTEYHPVVEARTAEVPTVQYHDVVEYQTVMRDLGHWQTNYECVPKLAPCQYDPRPGLTGWLNRTGYSLRSAFTPSMIARRQYIPNVVAQTVPVTRRVAEHGTRQVTYNVTKMVPTTTTRKVAVNKVRYVAQEITATQPVTVMRTLPIGSSVAYAVSPLGAPLTATALVPTADPFASAKGNDPRRTANSQDGKYQDDLYNQGDRFNRTTDPLPPDASRNDTGKGYSPDPRTSNRLPGPAVRTADPALTQAAPKDDGFRPTNKFRAAKLPTAIRARQFARSAQPEQSGPSLIGPGVSVADSGR